MPRRNLKTRLDPSKDIQAIVADLQNCDWYLCMVYFGANPEVYVDDACESVQW